MVVVVVVEEEEVEEEEGMDGGAGEGLAVGISSTSGILQKEVKLKERGSNSPQFAGRL